MLEASMKKDAKTSAPVKSPLWSIAAMVSTSNTMAYTADAMMFKRYVHIFHCLPLCVASKASSEEEKLRSKKELVQCHSPAAVMLDDISSSASTAAHTSPGSTPLFSETSVAPLHVPQGKLPALSTSSFLCGSFSCKGSRGGRRFPCSRS